jgi:hypothetical protein
MIISHRKFQQNNAADGDALFSASFHSLLCLGHKNLNHILEFIYWLNLYLNNEFSLLAVGELSNESIHQMFHGFICPFNLLMYTVHNFAYNLFAKRSFVLALVKILKLSSIITSASTYYLQKTCLLSSRTETNNVDFLLCSKESMELKVQ